MIELLDAAIEEEQSDTAFANAVGYALKAAMDPHFILNALVTALSVILSARHIQVMTTILGGVGTLLSSSLGQCTGLWRT